MLLKKLFQSRGAFFKNVLAISLGAVSGQAISLFIAPFLTRLYSPEQFGVLALFLSMTSILSIAASFRYELAIMLPKSIGEKIKIGKLTLILALAACAFSSFLFFVFEDFILNAFESSNHKYWLLLVGLGAFLRIAYQVFNYWSNSQKEYKKIGLSKFADSTSNNISKLAFGYIMPSHWGLIAGYFVGRIAGILPLFSSFSNLKKKIDENEKVLSYKALSKKYSDFAIKSTPAALFNVVSYNAPILLLGYFFGKELLGFYSLTDKVLYAPTIFIGTAIGQVFFQRASELKGTVKLSQMVKKTSLLLILFCVPVILILMVFGTFIFDLVFGVEWQKSGQIAAILAPFYFVRLIFASQANALTVLRKLHVELGVYIANFIGQTSSILIGFYYFKSFEISIMLMSATGTFVFLILGALIYYYSKTVKIEPDELD